MGTNKRGCLSNMLSVIIQFVLIQHYLGEVLPQSFVICLDEMQEIITNQKKLIENLTEIIQQTSLKVIVDEQSAMIKNLTKLVEVQRKVIEEKIIPWEIKGNYTKNIAS